MSLWLRAGAGVEAFEAFERGAQDLMSRYGGRIERCWRPFGGDPFEVQLVRFPGRGELAAYLADPDVTARVEERAQVIARTSALEVSAVDYLARD